MRPPTPESNTPIGRPSIARMIRPGSAYNRGLPFAAVTGLPRRALVVLLATAAALIASAPAGAFSRQDVRIPSMDGTALAATLTLPDAPPPASGWPAVITMHGLGQTRAVGLAVAQAMGLGERYAVLAFDARGHGDSGGLIGIDGPKEVADVKAVFGWLRDRPDVADRRIGGWGVSYGGGAAWNSLAAGVPWAALEISMSWTDLLHGARAAGAREDGRHHGVPRSARPEARRPGGARDPRRGVPRRPVRRAAVRRRTLLDLRPEGRPNAGLPHAGTP